MSSLDSHGKILLEATPPFGSFHQGLYISGAGRPLQKSLTSLKFIHAEVSVMEMGRTWSMEPLQMRVHRAAERKAGDRQGEVQS